MRVDFDKFDIEKGYILADELELWLLLKNESFLSYSKVESIIKNDKDKNIDNEESEIDVSNIINKFDELWETEILPQFLMRSKYLSDYYPFDFEDNSSKLVQKENWRNKFEYKLYLNLLVTSRLRFLDKSSRMKMASRFEQICKIALQGWLPHFEWKLFAWGSTDRKNFFDTNLRKALVKLAEFIQESPNRDYIYQKKSNGEHKLKHTGDKGLDLVGVRKFSEDQERGAIVIFGQCTAKSQDLGSKTLEAHPLKFKDYITSSNDPINIVFIPAFYREDDNEFPQRRNSESCLLIDRQRLLTMIEPKHIKQMPLSDFEIN